MPPGRLIDDWFTAWIIGIEKDNMVTGMHEGVARFHVLEPVVSRDGAYTIDGPRAEFRPASPTNRNEARAIDTGRAGR